jgi:hypothetical protein
MATSLPCYVRAILGGWIPDPGETVAVELDHADECALWYGAPCNCEPTTRLVDSDDWVSWTRAVRGTAFSKSLSHPRAAIFPNLGADKRRAVMRPTRAWNRGI